jgi:hypothetical protein
MAPTHSGDFCASTGLNHNPLAVSDGQAYPFGMSPLRRFWPILALLAGAALIAFELRRSHGLTLENAFWLLIGGLVVVLATVDLVQRRAKDRRV